MTGTTHERWTRERRVEHTRAVLLDTAEEMFARKGFEGAALVDIADAAGYTRGAIYAQFGVKEELFLAVNQRYVQRLIEKITELVGSLTRLGDLDLAEMAQQWREQATDRITAIDHAALGYEFTLFLIRNPEARAKVAAQRQEIVSVLAQTIADRVKDLGGTLRIPANTLAHYVVSTMDGVALGSHLGETDLYQPFLEMFVSIVKPAGD